MRLLERPLWHLRVVPREGRERLTSRQVSSPLPPCSGLLSELYGARL